LELIGKEKNNIVLIKYGGIKGIFVYKVNGGKLVIECD
jgi:hypothetical protein